MKTGMSKNRLGIIVIELNRFQSMGMMRRRLKVLLNMQLERYYQVGMKKLEWSQLLLMNMRS